MIVLSPLSRRSSDERCRSLKSWSERGIASVEYMATALIASAIISVLVAVPVSSQPTVTKGFQDGICNIFGGECGGEGSGEGGESAPEAQNPNDAVPACTVSRASQSGSITGKAGVWELGGGWALQHDVNSEGKHTMTLTSAVEGGAGKGVDVGTEIKGTDAEAALEAEAKINIGFEQGDTWEVDNEAEAGDLEEQLRDWVYYNMADDATFGFGGRLFAGLTNGPTPPRDPDSKSYTGEISGNANVSGNLGFDIAEALETKIGGQFGSGFNGQFGVETNQDGSYSISLDTGYGREFGANADVKADIPNSLPGLPDDQTPKTVGGEARNDLKRKQSITYKFDENHELVGLKVRQAKTSGNKFKVNGKSDESGGATDSHENDNFSFGLGGDAVTEEWYDMDMDFSQMTEEDRNAAFDRITKNPKPVNLADMMKNGPGEGKGENAIYNNSQLSRNVYEVDKKLIGDSFDFGVIGGEASGEETGYRLVKSEYAEAIREGKRNVQDNADCLK